MVLDDRESNRQPLVAMLRGAGYRTLEASGYHQALEMIGVNGPDLVITDILMAHMDGYEFVRLLRGQPDIDQPRVIFFTATYLVGQALEMAESCGVAHVIERTAEPATILHKVAALLDEEFTPAEIPEAEFDRSQMRRLS